MANRELAKKLESMDSICFRERVYDVHGKLRKRLFATEAQWTPGVELIHVGGPTRPSSIVVTPGGQAPAQTMPAAVWVIRQADPETGRAVVFTVPFAGAHARAARRVVVEPGGVLLIVSIAEHERRRKDVTGSAVVQ